METPRPQLPVPAALKVPAPAPNQPIRVDLPLREQTGFGEKLKRFLAKAGIALGLTAGASHMAGTKAEGMVEEAFEPIHDTLRPNSDEGGDQNPDHQQTSKSLLRKAKDAYNEALGWTADIAKETELIKKIDTTFTDLENLSKDIAYWSASVFTSMALMSLLTTYLAIQKLAGKKPMDPRVEAQIRALAEAVNQMGERLETLQAASEPPIPQDQEKLARNVGPAHEIVKAIKSS